MKNAVITSAAALMLLLSANVHASGELSPNDLRRITNEVQEMTTVLDLNESQANTIKEAKIEMQKANRKLVQEHGRGTAAFKEARKPYWQTYQKQLFTVISREDLRKFNQSR